jgi:hypothetical protein
MSELNAQQTATLLTVADANPSLAQVAAGTALDYTRADLRAGLVNLLRVAQQALADLNGQPVPMPRPHGTTGYRHPQAVELTTPI